jgi:hypothetical protein
MINFVSVWVGDRYGADYPAILHDMLARNASLIEDARHWCITDRPDELPEGVEAIRADPAFPGYWQKVRLFSSEMPWGHGERVAYFDLDVVITGRLEDLVQTPGIIKDWLWPGYNSSVMVWDHGQHREIAQDFRPEVMTRSPGPYVPAECLPAGVVNGGDQEWITECAGVYDHRPWPIFDPRWVKNYRLSARDWPPSDCRVVSFNGEPKPHEVTEGWVPTVWKLAGATSLPAMDGMNAEYDDVWANVRANCDRDLPWFAGHLGGAKQKKAAVLVCGAPSMRDCLPQIRAHRDRGCPIISVNNAWRFLRANGITPNAHVMLDARPDNAEFVRDAPEATHYFIASQCDAGVFEALKDRKVTLWHNGIGDGSELREILSPWWGEGPEQRPCLLVPGGGTVGLRSLWLLAFGGYRTIHVYGMDSSYAGDEHHAYPQSLNDADRTLGIVLQAKTYRCALWMARQAEEFKQHWRDLRREGVNVLVHGEGLIPDLCKALRAGEQ